KTTAAFGLAIRAALSGKKVYIGQFIKDMKYNETKITSLLPQIKIEQLGYGCFITGPPEEKDILKAKEALERCSSILKSGEYDLVILDEVVVAIYLKLLSEDAVIKAVREKAPNVETILTGRYASHNLIEMADLVTEMKEVKHYYNKGVLSRNGIDY
ncbi:MAG: cob(I)yrinic acid a,c-diamide adenosyltransferase, partial [Tissierellia bacterium]|nr:cob(I)yrinic acid a,c-diamide adenosyltransferase [Tissierellia bacterium]